MSKLFNVLVNTKLSGVDLKYLIKSIVTALKDLKNKGLIRERDITKLKTLIDFCMIFSGIKLKVDYDVGFFKSNQDLLRALLGLKSMGENIIENMFKPAVIGIGFNDLFTSINFDCLSLSLGIPKYENGLSLVFKMPGLNQYFEGLFK